MSESSSVNTSVLLPAARVALFANDAATVAAFKSLQEDWRFARVHMAQYAAGVDETIRVLQSGVAVPELLIIETDVIDDSFTAKLENLANHCPEGTAAIVIGPVNDVNLYRRLIAMGISDYLVRPVPAETLASDIARTLIERVGAGGSRLIGVAGAKGGVGVSAVSQALAWAAADVLKQKAVLMDVAGGWSSLSVGMNFEPATTLNEAARVAAANNEDAFKRMLFHASERLDVLSTGGDAMLERLAESSACEKLLDKLMTTYPVVIVDLSQAPVELMKMMITRAHEIMLVTTPTLPSLRAARTLIHEIKDIRSDADQRIDLIVNMAGMAGKQEVAKADIEAALERKPVLTIDFEPGVFVAAESEGRKLNATPAGNEIVRSLAQLMSKIVDSVSGDLNDAANDDTGRKNPLGGILGKLGKK